MMLRWSLVGLAIVIACSGCGNDEPTTNPTASGFADTAGPLQVAQKDPGAALYHHYCADCHNPGDGHPGTMRLARRLAPEQAVLRERTDLSPAYVRTIVRNGLQMMPPFRPSEIADAELDALSRYVTAKYAAPAGDEG